VISPTLFTIMINDIFGSIPAGMGRSLFADDRALWKRESNIDHIVKKLQEGIDHGEKSGLLNFQWRKVK